MGRFNNAEAFIRAYHVDHDILTQFQTISFLSFPKAIGRSKELDGDQDANFIIADALLIAGSATGITLSAVLIGAGIIGLGVSLHAYAGYQCHTLTRLLYGFLVKESSSGLLIDEDLLGLPI